MVVKGEGWAADGKEDAALSGHRFIAIKLQILFVL